MNKIDELKVLLRSKGLQSRGAWIHSGGDPFPADFFFGDSEDYVHMNVMLRKERYHLLLRREVLYIELIDGSNRHYPKRDCFLFTDTYADGVIDVITCGELYVKDRKFIRGKHSWYPQEKAQLMYEQAIMVAIVSLEKRQKPKDVAPPDRIQRT